MAKPVAIKDLKQEQRLFQRRILATVIVIALLICALICRLIYLQVFQHELYETLSQNNKQELLPIAPNRGLIYDRNGVLLAKNIPVFSLDIIPDHVTNLQQTITALQTIIPISSDEIQQFYRQLKQHSRSTPTILKLRLTEQQVAQFDVNQYRFPGVEINARLIRSYPLGAETASVVGYVGRINAQELTQLDQDNYSDSYFIGKTGIEKYYEQQLHGIVGYQQVEIDADGHIVRTLKRTPPIPGDNIYLTIDSRLQAVAQKALGSESGAAIAIQPETGEILALVSNPSFDPNLLAQGISTKEFDKLQNAPEHPMFNRAIRGQFPLASTIKPFIALEGLDSGTITPDYTIHDPGWFQLPNNSHVYRDWNWRNGGHGNVNVTKAIIVSSDTFFYNLAVMLGINRFDDILSRFGFGRNTGIDMPNEIAGLISSPAWKLRTKGVPWYTGDTVNSGIGQGFMLTTPIQLATATATLANRGLRFKPHLLLELKPPNQPAIMNPPSAEDPVMLNHQSPWQVVINAMSKVVYGITARFRFGPNPQYSVAAKSGTGQVYSHDRDEEERSVENIPKRLRNDSLFIAFAPIKHPKIALAVVVEHSPIAGTVARKMLDYYLITEPKAGS